MRIHGKQTRIDKLPSTSVINTRVRFSSFVRPSNLQFRMHMHVQSIRLVNAGLFLASAGDSHPANIQSASDSDTLERCGGLAASDARTTGVACVKCEHRMKSRVRTIGCIAASSARVAESSSRSRHRHGGRFARGESCEYPIASRGPGRFEAAVLKNFIVTCC